MSAKNYIVVATLVYRVTAEDADEAKDVVRVTTDNPADMEGVEFLTGDYIVELKEWLLS